MMVTRTPGAMSSTNRIDEINTSQAKTLERIATGKRINTASDDAAGLAVSTVLESQVRGLNRSIFNRQDEISLIQTADSGIGNVGEAVQRMRELSIQSANGTLTDDDRKSIQMEVDQLKQQIDQTSKDTGFNTKKLLDGTLDISLQNGNNLKIPNMNSASLGVSNIDVSTQAGANSSIAYADQALDSITSQRSTLGATQNGIASEVRGLKEQVLNTLSANSNIADTDIAQEIIRMNLQQLQSKAAIQTFKVDSAMRGNVLQLLG